MKRLFTLAALAVSALGAMATDYTDVLEVSVNGVPSTQTATISVNKNANGNYDLALKNFMLVAGTESLPVGNIEMTNVSGTTSGDGVTTLTHQAIVPITDGDDPNVAQWFGPLMIKQVPVVMTAELRDSSLYTVLDIDLSATLGQVVKVVFGNGGYQIANSGFELFHTAKADKNGKYTSDEPNSWHSFMSCTGTLSAFVCATPHTFISNDVRPGSLGTKSVLVTSGLVFGVPANGTITTGRLNAGSMTPADILNCAFLDMTSTEADSNGDPFYTKINGAPDSLAVWVKFKQGTLNKPEYKYATLSAAITNGGYYQDPGDSVLANVVARGSNKAIESKGNVWQRVTMPFDYDSYACNDIKAILITLSTNAEPGVASTESKAPDSLLIDDLSLIYNAKLASLNVPGFNKEVMDYETAVNGQISLDDIQAVADGRGAKVTKALETVDGGVKATVTVKSGDLRSSNVYTILYKGATVSGINLTEKSAPVGVSAVYDLNGQRVDTMRSGRIYIEKRTDGTVVKTIKR